MASMENDEDLEEGEINEDDAPEVEDVYVPLERPQKVSVLRSTVAPIQDLSDREEPSSSSDSDNSRKCRNAVKQRKKSFLQRPYQSLRLPPKKKIYDIWCNDLAEEALTTNLVNCSVDQNIDRSRNVESYNHLLAFPHMKEVKTVLRDTEMSMRVGRGGYKRNRCGRLLDALKKNNHGEEKKGHGNSREIPSLVKTINDSPEDLAQDIANKLCEEKEDLILTTITVLGKEAVIKIFEETRATERDGGLMIMNGSRRRTPGGVFFHLIKGSTLLRPDQTLQIFGSDKKLTASERRKSQREARKARTAQRKEALRKEDYPTLLSKAEAAIRKMKEESQQESEDAAEDGGVKNPPPSPATDGKDTDGEEVKALEASAVDDVMDI